MEGNHPDKRCIGWLGILGIGQESTVCCITTVCDTKLVCFLTQSTSPSVFYLMILIKAWKSETQSRNTTQPARAIEPHAQCSAVFFQCTKKRTCVVSNCRPFRPPPRVEKTPQLCVHTRSSDTRACSCSLQPYQIVGWQSHERLHIYRLFCWSISSAGHQWALSEWVWRELLDSKRSAAFDAFNSRANDNTSLVSLSRLSNLLPAIARNGEPSQVWNMYWRPASVTADLPVSLTIPGSTDATSFVRRTDQRSPQFAEGGGPAQLAQPRGSACGRKMT